MIACAQKLGAPDNETLLRDLTRGDPLSPSGGIRVMLSNVDTALRFIHATPATALLRYAAILVALMNFKQHVEGDTHLRKSAHLRIGEEVILERRHAESAAGSATL